MNLIKMWYDSDYRNQGQLGVTYKTNLYNSLKMSIGWEYKLLR